MVRVALAAETGWSNSGDDLMLRGTAAAIRMLDPEAALIVITPNAWEVRRFMEPGVPCVESPLLTLDESIGGTGSRISRRDRRAVDRTLRAAGDERTDPANPIRQSVEAIRQADALVFAGGGYLTDQWPLTVRNARFLGETATRLGRPFFLFGHSIGPLRERATRDDVARLLQGAAGIAVRESGSAREVAALLGVPAPDPIGDPALLLHEARASIAPENRVVVNLRDHVPEDRNLRPAIADGVGEVARRLGLELGFVEAGRPPSYDDAAAHRELDALVPADVSRTEPSPQAPGRIDLPPARLVMAVSYHVCLLALARGVPTVGLATTPYVGHKLKGLFEAFERPEWVWSPDGAGDLARIAEAAAADPEPKDLRRIAEESAARLGRWLGEHVLAAH
jgi:polysaccharide pyruvyl transferase WcaK-like protein